MWKIGMASSQCQAISWNCQLVLGPTYVPVKNIKAMFAGARKKEKSRRLNVGTQVGGIGASQKKRAHNPSDTETSLADHCVRRDLDGGVDRALGGLTSAT